MNRATTTMTALALIALALLLFSWLQREPAQAAAHFQSPLPEPTTACAVAKTAGFTLELFGYVENGDGTINEGRFYLLNRGSSFNPDNPIDLRMVHIAAEPEITAYKLAVRDPVLGFIDGEFLWAYHQPIAEKTENTFWAITRTNLSTGESNYWPLPDYWWAGDMITLNGKIVLTRRDSADPNETDGLYEFSPETGKLTQILELPGAHLLLAPHGQGENSGDGTE